jgi:hypothetical protein
MNALPAAVLSILSVFMLSSAVSAATPAAHGHHQPGTNIGVHGRR